MKALPRIWLSVAIALALTLAASAQFDKKPYSEWSEKEAMKLLNDSPWAHTQTFADTSSLTGNARLASGASRIGEDFQVNFRIRFLSSKPVRQATSRMIELQKKGELDEALAQRLKAFAEADFPDYIVITATVDAPRPSNHLQQATSVLLKLNTAALENNTYILAGNGQRVYIKEYQPPRNDGLGARFIFPRLIDGKPFITAETDTLLFHAELMESKAAAPGSSPSAQSGPTSTSSLTPFGSFVLDMRFKVKEMMFAGRLEY